MSLLTTGQKISGISGSAHKEKNVELIFLGHSAQRLIAILTELSHFKIVNMCSQKYIFLILV
jgi:hypothetical protein